MRGLKNILSFSIILIFLCEVIIFWYYSVAKEYDHPTLWHCHKIFWSMTIPTCLLYAFMLYLILAMYYLLKDLDIFRKKKEES